MQSSVEDEERELEVIKEVFEKGNIHALDSLPLNLPHKKAKISTSAKIPKKLSKKEIEKREERKKLKEIERIENIQKKLFGERKGKFNELKRQNLLEPIKKKNKNEPMICENKLLKECREMFGKENTKVYFACFKRCTGIFRLQAKRQSYNSTRRNSDLRFS